MRRLITVLLLLVVVVFSLGFYLGWFSVSTDSAGQRSNVTITVDKERIRQDEEKAKEKIQEGGQKLKKLIGPETEKRDNEGQQP